MPRPGKAGSKAERDALRQEMLVGGCSLELIATEMERRWGFRPREAYRHAHGWSQDEVAARFTEVADRIGGERVAEGRPAPAQAAPMIGTRIGEYERWPKGGRRPSPYVLTVLAAVLGTTVERLLDYEDHRKMPDQERTVLAAVLAAASPPVPLPGTGVPPALAVPPLSERLPSGRLITGHDLRAPGLPFTPDEPDGPDGTDPVGSGLLLDPRPAGAGRGGPAGRGSTGRGAAVPGAARTGRRPSTADPDGRGRDGRQRGTDDRGRVGGLRRDGRGGTRDDARGQRDTVQEDGLRPEDAELLDGLRDGLDRLRQDGLEDGRRQERLDEARRDELDQHTELDGFDRGEQVDRPDGADEYESDRLDGLGAPTGAERRDSARAPARADRQDQVDGQDQHDGPDQHGQQDPGDEHSQHDQGSRNSEQVRNGQQVRNGPQARNGQQGQDGPQAWNGQQGQDGPQARNGQQDDDGPQVRDGQQDRNGQQNQDGPANPHGRQDGHDEDQRGERDRSDEHDQLGEEDQDGAPDQDDQQGQPGRRGRGDQLDERDQPVEHDQNGHQQGQRYERDRWYQPDEHAAPDQDPDVEGDARDRHERRQGRHDPQARPGAPDRPDARAWEHGRPGAPDRPDARTWEQGRPAAGAPQHSGDHPAPAGEIVQLDDLASHGRLQRRVPQPVPPPLPDPPYITVAIDPAAPDTATAARRHRRDRLIAGTQPGRRSDEEVIMDAAGQSAEFGEWAEGTNVGSTTLEQLDEDVRRISREYLSNPPLPLMLGALRVRNRVFTLLEGRQHPDQTRHLYLTAGRLCGLLAWMASDVGRHAEAETQARTAWLCAELAGANGLRAWVRATQSKVAYWDGRIQESASLAGDGLQYAASDSARVLLASLSARAWARIGDKEEAHAALHTAQDERERAGEDEVGGLLGFSEAQQSYMAGSTHLWLKEPAEALAASDRAVWLFDVGNQSIRFYGAEMLALVDAATALMQSGELEGAAERLRPVLNLPPEQQLDTFTSRLGELRDALRRSRYAMSRPSVDLQRQIEEFRSGALGQILSR